MKKIIFLFILLGFRLVTQAQQVSIGQWRTHLPYNQVLSVTESDKEIYCATTGGLFSIHKQNNELNKWSTINGLADISTKIVSWNNYTKQLLVVYKNSNIDLIKGDQIYHLPQLFEKTGLGDKTINAVTFNQQFAYLSCAFGVLIYDLERREVKDTYYLGSGGTYLNVYNIAIDGLNIFVATADGIYQTSLNNSAISNVNTWIKHSSVQNIPNGINKSIVSFQGSIYGLFDTGIYKFKSNTWTLTNIFAPNVEQLKTSNNFLLTIAPFRVISYDANENIKQNIQNTNQFNAVNDAIISADNQVLIADAKRGLVQTVNGTVYNFTLPNGPNTIAAKELKFNDGKLFLAPGAITDIFSPAYNNDGFSVFENEEWKSFYNQTLNVFQPIRDIVTSAYQNTTATTFLGSYVNGVLAFNQKTNDLKVYNEQNSTLQTTVSDASSIRVNGMALDSKDNLWVTQYGVNKPLSFLQKSNNQWFSFAFPDQIPDPITTVTGLMIDQQDQKWLLLKNSGVIVFNGTLSRKINFGINAIPGTNLNCLTTDKEGAVWVGTNQGVAVIYHPEDVFTNLAVEIPNLIEDGFLKPLLASENINCIATDGANRKWIGTNNGVWLFNADGSKQLLNFNTNNSPLLNNKVLSIAIEPNTGEVFFGTVNGIISYKGDATEPVQKMSKVTVYPNPVRPGYAGVIGIKGLVDKAVVKITDINGTLVYETIANGGEATWNRKNFKGEAAGSGVYLVLVVSKDGSDIAVSKILLVN